MRYNQLMGSHDSFCQKKINTSFISVLFGFSNELPTIQSYTTIVEIRNYMDQWSTCHPSLQRGFKTLYGAASTDYRLQLSCKGNRKENKRTKHNDNNRKIRTNIRQVK
jgi:hypothetical protein